ncbi:MAG: hypothetical protein EOO40_02715, partial [Deltaproteobacteria bacterium]
MTTLKTEYLIQGKAQGFADVQRQLTATNEKLNQSQRDQAKTAKALAEALGLASQQAKTTGRAIDDIG